jgi:ABC-2 type transport system ATP-binding protein
VAIISRGEVVARGTPENLGDRESRPATVSYAGPEGEVSLQTTTPVETLHELTGRALADGVDLEGLEVTRPSLEDIYLELTSEGEERAKREAM